MFSDGTYILFPHFVFHGERSMIEERKRRKMGLKIVFQAVVHREVKTGFGSYVLKKKTHKGSQQGKSLKKKI